MFCRKCGTQNEDNAWKCVKCGEVLQEAPKGASAPTITIPNYLVQSIIVTILCCVPIGIVAIIFSTQVNTKIAANDIKGAQESSKKAKMWAWIAFGSGLVFGILYFALVMVGAIAGAGGR